MTDGHSDTVGIVVFGRNEGERLHRCLLSALASAERVVYVDSGSSDGSCELAASLGVTVEALDLSRPFTAARARNAGFMRLQSNCPEIVYVQFVDGDCELDPAWIETARSFLDAHPDYAAVHGRRRERFPEASPYNRLCDMEWDVGPGDIRAFGGDVMLRSGALAALGGYRDDMIAGEDPELSFRLRAEGWKLMALDAEMTRHDAAMLHFGQWWRRVVRSGYAYALGAWLHVRSPERHWVHESLRAWIWAAGPIAGACLLAWPLGGWALTLLLVYPAQWLRLAIHGEGSTGDRVLRATAQLLGRFAEWQGQLEFLSDLLRRRRRRIIEYK